MGCLWPEVWAACGQRYGCLGSEVWAACGLRYGMPVVWGMGCLWPEVWPAWGLRYGPPVDQGMGCLWIEVWAFLWPECDYNYLRQGSSLAVPRCLMWLMFLLGQQDKLNFYTKCNCCALQISWLRPSRLPMIFLEHSLATVYRLSSLPDKKLPYGSTNHKERHLEYELDIKILKEETKCHFKTTIKSTIK